MIGDNFADDSGVAPERKGTGDIAKAVVDTVSGTLTQTIKGTGTVGTSLIEAVSDVGRAAIRGAAEVGADVGSAAKGAVGRDVARNTRNQHRSRGDN